MKNIKKWTNPEIESLNFKKTADMYAHMYKCTSCGIFMEEPGYRHFTEGGICPCCGKGIISLYMSWKEIETGHWDCPCDDGTYDEDEYEAYR